MHLEDGFYDGIYNYCDRWCERCPYTRWCRLFADSTELDAELDSNFKAVVDAAPLIHEIPPPPPPEVQALVDELNAVAEAFATAPPVPASSRTAHRQHPLAERALSYSREVHLWICKRGITDSGDPHNPASVVSWHSTFIPAKITRALRGLEDRDLEDLVGIRDSDGSAKVALAGLEESHSAWLQLVERGVATSAQADVFITDIVWLTDEVERLFPSARTFVRPVFDEPQVAYLLRTEGL